MKNKLIVLNVIGITSQAKRNMYCQKLQNYKIKQCAELKGEKIPIQAIKAKKPMSIGDKWCVIIVSLVAGLLFAAAKV